MSSRTHSVIKDVVRISGLGIVLPNNNAKLLLCSNKIGGNQFKIIFITFLIFLILLLFIVITLLILLILLSFIVITLLILLILLLLSPDISIMVRVFANGPEDLGSIPGRVIPKTPKMALDASLLNTQHYKVRIRGKVGQSWERSSALPYTSV